MALLISAAIIFSSCSENQVSQSQKNPQPEEQSKSGTYILPLIETTDIHGYIADTSGSKIHYRLSYIADKVKDIRGHGDESCKEKLLLLDGGDLYQGASVSNLLNGEPVYTVIDRMNYDAVCLGNHEFDWGIENLTEEDGTLPRYILNDTEYSNEIPLLCANLYKDGKRVSFTKDYIITEKTASDSNGNSIAVKIAVIGFADDWSSSVMETQFTQKGYSISLDYEKVNELAAQLESEGACDATVLLIHGDSKTAAEKLSENTAVDFVLGGHTHCESISEENFFPPYLQCKAYGKFYSRADMTFFLDENGKISFTGVKNKRTIGVDESKDTHTSGGENSSDLDEEILSITDNAISRIDPAFMETVGYITVSASSYPINGSDGRASVMGNWMCDIIKRISGAEISFVNSGGIRTYLQIENGQTQRNITVSNIYEIFPFNNRIYTYEITYGELLSVFEYALSSAGQSLFSCVTGIDCIFTKTEKISSSGKTYYEYKLKSLKKDGTEIYDGQWKDDWENRKVRLALQEFSATTNRKNNYSPENPLIEWNKTNKLIDSSLTDSENAISVLRKEASENDGKLYLDTKAHFILSDDE